MSAGLRAAIAATRRPGAAVPTAAATRRMARRRTRYREVRFSMPALARAHESEQHQPEREALLARVGTKSTAGGNWEGKALNPNWKYQNSVNLVYVINIGF